MAKSVAPKSTLKNASALSVAGRKEVDDFMKQLDHPLKKTMELLRQIILSSNKEIIEHIKWKGPSFVHNGDDKITLSLHKEGMVMIIFHRGAKAKDSKGKETLFKDTTGLLEWLSPDRAGARFSSLTELKAKSAGFKKVVKQWLEAAQ